MKHWLLRALLAMVGMALLALFFIAYLQPAFILDLANRLFLCM